jgi:hypothetical protein
VTINATTARQWRPLFQLEGFDRTLAMMERPENINPLLSPREFEVAIVLEVVIEERHVSGSFAPYDQLSVIP